jgi:predicted nucleic acid-binding protein
MPGEPIGSRRALLQTLFGEDAFERVAPTLAETYGRLAPRIWDALVTTQLKGRPELAREVETPVVEVVHSIATRPLSSFQGGKWYLTYDQHLGQVLSRLTRLVLSEADPEAVDRYLEKLFAQRLAVAGQFLAALAMGKRCTKPVLPPIESPKQSNRRFRFVHGQEAFVIGHELTHILLGQIPQLRDELAQEVFRFLEVDVGVSATRRREAFEEDWDSSIRAALQRYGLEPRRDRYPARWDPPEDEAAALTGNPDLLEECICDFAGSIASALATARPGGISVGDSFIASAMALHNLRLLQQLDEYARGTETQESESAFAASMTRLSVHRTVIRAFCHVMNRSLAIDPAHVVRETVAFNKAYAAVIGDPLLFVWQFDQFVDRVEREVAKNFPDQKEPPWSRQQRSILRAQLGFASEAVRAELMEQDDNS